MAGRSESLARWRDDSDSDDAEAGLDLTVSGTIKPGHSLTIKPRQMAALVLPPVSTTPPAQPTPRARHIQPVVDLSYGKLHHSPLAFAEEAVEALYLSSNDLETTAPLDLGNFRSLRVLDLSFNRLTSVPPEIFALGNLTDVDLRGNRITVLPGVIVACSNLERLLLHKNELSELPDVFDQLRRLRVLDASLNHLISLPRSLVMLGSSLATLQLDGNQLTQLPAAIGQLRKLSKLTVANNKLAFVPDSLARLTLLEELDLSGNQITSFPSAIFPALQNLRECYLNNNSLAELPADVGAAKLLEVLDLRKNPLTLLPNEIEALARLEELRVDLGPEARLPAPLLDALRRDAKSAQAYMRDCAKSAALPEACEASGPGVEPQAVAQTLLSFTVRTFDRTRQPKTRGGDPIAVLVDVIAGDIGADATIASQRVPATVVDRQDGTYVASYAATVVGVYTVAVFCHRKPIKGSPFRVMVLPGKAVPSQCTVLRSSVEVSAGVEAPLRIAIKDAHGAEVLPDSLPVFETRLLEGDGLVAGVDATAAAKITSAGNILTFSSTLAGRYRLAISLAGEQIRGSPVAITVVPGVTYAAACTVASRTGRRMVVGTPTSVLIQARDKHGNAQTVGGDVFTVVLTAQDHTFVTADVVDHRDGTYTAVFTPTRNGPHTLDIKLQQPNGVGKPISGSPITDLVGHPADATVVTVEPLAQENARLLRELAALSQRYRELLSERSPPRGASFRRPSTEAETTQVSSRSDTLTSQSSTTSSSRIESLRRRYEELSLDSPSGGSGSTLGGSGSTLRRASISRNGSRPMLATSSTGSPSALSVSEVAMPAFVTSLVNHVRTHGLPLAPLPARCMALLLADLLHRQNYDAMVSSVQLFIKEMEAAARHTRVDVPELAFWLANCAILARACAWDATQQARQGSGTLTRSRQPAAPAGTMTRAECVARFAAITQRLEEVVNDIARLLCKEVEETLEASIHAMLARAAGQYDVLLDADEPEATVPTILSQTASAFVCAGLHPGVGAAFLRHLITFTDGAIATALSNPSRQLPVAPVAAALGDVDANLRKRFAMVLDVSRSLLPTSTQAIILVERLAAAPEPTAMHLDGLTDIAPERACAVVASFFGEKTAGALRHALGLGTGSVAAGLSASVPPRMTLSLSALLPPEHEEDMPVLPFSLRFVPQTIPVELVRHTDA